MDGIWVRSQNGENLVCVKIFEVWDSGRIVARIGKDYKHLGDYPGNEAAQDVLDKVEEFINTSRNRIYQMPGGN